MFYVNYELKQYFYIYEVKQHIYQLIILNRSESVLIHINDAFIFTK